MYTRKTPTTRYHEQHLEENSLKCTSATNKTNRGRSYGTSTCSNPNQTSERIPRTPEVICKPEHTQPKATEDHNKDNVARNRKKKPSTNPKKVRAIPYSLIKLDLKRRTSPTREKANREQRRTE